MFAAAFRSGRTVSNVPLKIWGVGIGALVRERNSGIRCRQGTKSRGKKKKKLEAKCCSQKCPQTSDYYTSPRGGLVNTPTEYRSNRSPAICTAAAQNLTPEKKKKLLCITGQVKTSSFSADVHLYQTRTNPSLSLHLQRTQDIPRSPSSPPGTESLLSTYLFRCIILTPETKKKLICIIGVL